MMDIDVQRKFNVISEDFRNNNFNLQTVSNLIVEIRSARSELSADDIRKLLLIPISVLRNDVKVSDRGHFYEMGHYFSGNVTGESDPVLKEFSKKFSSKDYDLDDIVKYTKHISDHLDIIGGNIEFLLRNTEVIIRDDVSLYEHGDFKKSGRVFAKLIDEVIGF